MQYYIIYLYIYLYKDNPIQPSGIEDFSNNLFYITTLIKLNISNDMIGDKGMRSISYNLSNLKNLQYFDISSNEITDRGLKFFSESISELVVLEVLNLSRIYMFIYFQTMRQKMKEWNYCVIYFLFFLL